MTVAFSLAIRRSAPQHEVFMKPLIGISCCRKPVGAHAMPTHTVSDTYVRAVDALVGIPVLLPANGEKADIPGLIARLDGLLLTGSPSNVCPALYDGPCHPTGTPEDPFRDSVTLPLIRAALAAGLACAGDLSRLAGAQCRAGWQPHPNGARSARAPGSRDA